MRTRMSFKFNTLLALFQPTAIELTVALFYEMIESRTLLRVLNIRQLKCLLHKKMVTPLFQVGIQDQIHVFQTN